jgi:hypothetical protein
MIELHEESPTPSGSAVVIRCADSAAVDGVARCVDMALDLGHTRLVLDLGSGERADAELLSVVHRSAWRLREMGGRLAVVCADSRLRRLLDLTLRSQGFGVYATREEALAA